MIDSVDKAIELRDAAMEFLRARKVNGFHSATLMEPSPCFSVIIVDDGSDVAELNRDIRNWCGRNLPNVSWETINTNYGVAVYFDITTSDDELMAFRLVWMD